MVTATATILGGSSEVKVSRVSVSAAVRLTFSGLLTVGTIAWLDVDDVRIIHALYRLRAGAYPAGFASDGLPIQSPTKYASSPSRRVLTLSRPVSRLS